MSKNNNNWYSIPYCKNRDHYGEDLYTLQDQAFHYNVLIRRNLSPDDVILQLAEEAAELAQAAAKYLRARRGKNPTPVSVDEAYRKMREEYIDVINCAYILNLDLSDAVVQNDGALTKLDRWVERLTKGKRK